MGVRADGAEPGSDISIDETGTTLRWAVVLGVSEGLKLCSHLGGGGFLQAGDPCMNLKRQDPLAGGPDSEALSPKRALVTQARFHSYIPRKYSETAMEKCAHGILV